MSTQVQIYNLTLANMGEALLTTAADDTNPADVLNALWDGGEVDTILDMGPEEGWKFANRTYHGIDRDSATITAFADLVTGTTTTVTATHTLEAGDMVTIAGTTSYDGDYDVVSVSTTVSFVITKAFVADDATGIAKWTSEEFLYRYAKPTSLRVTAVKVGGVELTDWTEKGAYILTNQEDTEVDMDYILPLASLTTTNFPSHFVGVLWRYLRVLLAYNFIQNKSMGDQYMQELETIWLPRAIGMDNRSGYVKEENLGWIEAGRTRSDLQ